MRETRAGEPMTIAQWVKALRARLGKTQDELAEMIGSDKGAVIKWENNERKSINNKFLKALLTIAPPDLRASCPALPADAGGMSDPGSTIASDSLGAFIDTYRRVLTVEEADILRSIGPKVERGGTITGAEWREIAEAVLRRKLPEPPSGSTR